MCAAYSLTVCWVTIFITGREPGDSTKGQMVKGIEKDRKNGYNRSAEMLFIESDMRALAKQLIIGAFILALVTVASLGIRRIRFSIHRTDVIESPVIAEAGPDSIPAEPDTVVIEAEPEYVEVTEPDEEAPLEEDSEVKPSKGDYAKATSYKKDLAKFKSRGLEQIPLGENENLYRTKTGELWHVSKQPDGKTVKMQVHLDDATGEITVIDAKSGGSQNLEKVSLGDYDNLYITESGEQWYVSDNPDGSSSKSRIQIDDTTGEITVLEDYSDNGKERETKD